MKTSSSSSIDTRVSTILKKETKVQKTERVQALLRQTVNQRTKRGANTNPSQIVGHGTNLAAVLSALRNSNGQLVPIKMMTDLGFDRRTGATAKSFIDSIPQLLDLVFGADLRFGSKAVETLLRYADTAVANGGNGALETIETSSEASGIPVVVVGELIDDANGYGAKFNEPFLNATQETIAAIPEGNPLFGLDLEVVKEIFVDQAVGIRFNIHGILIAPSGSSPLLPFMKNAENDVEESDDANGEILELTKKLVQQASEEQQRDYSDIHIGLITRELYSFHNATFGRRNVNVDEIQQYLYPTL